jgi:hypothetical protein
MGRLTARSRPDSVGPARAAEPARAEPATPLGLSALERVLAPYDCDEAAVGSWIELVGSAR